MPLPTSEVKSTMMTMTTKIPVAFPATIALLFGLLLSQLIVVDGFSFGRSLSFLLKMYGTNEVNDPRRTTNPKNVSTPELVYCLDERERSFRNSHDYVQYLKTIAKLPKGFRVGSVRFNFQPLEIQNKQLPMNLSMILLDKPTQSFAAAFTSNQFPGGPILVGKQRLQCSESLQAVIINNKISNVCPNGVEDFGYQDSDNLCEAVASCLQLPSKQVVFPSSTGIIGWRLPVKTITEHIPQLPVALQDQSILPLALGIMTTDRYPKIRSYQSRDQTWSIVGVAKGAGMIEPNLATMLSYLLTDLPLSKSQLQRSLEKVLSSTYNSISVDGDQSTSDTVLLLSSGEATRVKVDDPKVIREFESALYSICYKLSEDIVRNGEGTQHVIRVKLRGLSNPRIAKLIGKSIINSSLVKCAIAGNDPNVGRIVSSIGSVLGNMILPLLDLQQTTSATASPFSFQKDQLRISLGNIIIFEKGGFQLNPEKEEQLYRYLLSCQLYEASVFEHDRTYPPHERCVELLLEFLSSDGGDSHSEYEVIGSDLTKEYVEINADYRS